MDFANLFARLGRGFGLVKALQTVTSRINDLRIQVTDGLIASTEEINRERDLMNQLHNFMHDDRWKDVVSLKESGRVEEAREKARALRKDYDL